MASPKSYIHDRMVLLLLTISTFLTLLGSALILLLLDPSRNQGYVVQYRADLGISNFKTGHVTDLLAFIVFLFLVLIINTIMSIRVYNTHRPFAIAILGLGVLLLVLAIIVSNALLVLR